METIGAFEAKTHLSELLERVERGEEFTITRHGRPVAKLSGVGARADAGKVRAAIARLKALADKHTLQGDWKEMRDLGRR